MNLPEQAAASDAIEVVKAQLQQQQRERDLSNAKLNAEKARLDLGVLLFPDPRTAYTLLDAASRKRTSEDRFVELAKKYTRNLGFGVEMVHVHVSDEHGDDATAHLTLVGTGKRFEDGITLRRADGKWSAVLPANFGHATK